MRVLHDIGDSFLDFIEENRYGTWLFRLARFGFFAMVLLVVGKVASGQFLSFHWHDILFMSIAALGALIIAYRPSVGLLVIIGTTGFIFHVGALPTLSLYHFVPEIRWLEDFRLFLGQGVLLFCLGLFVLSRQSSTMAERLATPMTPAVLAFCAAVVITGAVGVVFNDILFKHMVGKARDYSYYLTFFVALLCIRNRTDLKFVCIGLVVMTVIVALGMGLQFFSGNSVRIFVGEARVEGVVGSYATRILPPGQVLVWLVMPPLVAITPKVQGAGRVWLLLALWATAAGLLLTLTRAMWMGNLIALVAMTIVASHSERIGISRILLIFLALVFFLLLLLGTISTGTENYMAAYIQRFTSVFTSEAYVESSTIGSRMDEVRAAWEHIVERPWLGIGLGGIYDYALMWNNDTYSFEWRGITNIHNVYVLILTKMGALGLTTLLIMLTTYFVRAWRIYKSLPEGIDRALVLGGMGSTLSAVIASNLQASLAGAGAVSILALIWGITEFLRWWHEHGAERQSASRVGSR